MFNESAALTELHDRLDAVLSALETREGISSEILAVNDGSGDGTRERLDAISSRNSRFRVLHLPRNLGQHEAVLEGFAATHSPLVVTLDADLQNPPEEIPRVVAALRAGHDLVATRRVSREDSLGRRVVSRIANASTQFLLRAYTTVPIHDIGCMLRGYRREVVDRVVANARRPGSPAPFIPALSLSVAHNVCEIPVEHSRRLHGKSRYGLRGLARLHTRLLVTLLQGPQRES